MGGAAKMCVFWRRHCCALKRFTVRIRMWNSSSSSSTVVRDEMNRRRCHSDAAAHDVFAIGWAWKRVAKDLLVVGFVTPCRKVGLCGEESLHRNVDALSRGAEVTKLTVLRCGVITSLLRALYCILEYDCFFNTHYIGECVNYLSYIPLAWVYICVVRMWRRLRFNQLRKKQVTRVAARSTVMDRCGKNTRHALLIDLPLMLAVVACSGGAFYEEFVWHNHVESRSARGRTDWRRWEFLLRFAFVVLLAIITLIKSIQFFAYGSTLQSQIRRRRRDTVAIRRTSLPGGGDGPSTWHGHASPEMARAGSLKMGVPLSVARSATEARASASAATNPTPRPVSCPQSPAAAEVEGDDGRSAAEGGVSRSRRRSSLTDALNSTITSVTQTASALTRKRANSGTLSQAVYNIRRHLQQVFLLFVLGAAYGAACFYSHVPHAEPVEQWQLDYRKWFYLAQSSLWRWIMYKYVGLFIRTLKLPELHSVRFSYGVAHFVAVLGRERSCVGAFRCLQRSHFWCGEYDTASPAASENEWNEHTSDSSAEPRPDTEEGVSMSPCPSSKQKNKSAPAMVKRRDERRPVAAEDEPEKTEDELPPRTQKPLLATTNRDRSESPAASIPQDRV